MRVCSTFESELMQNDRDFAAVEVRLRRLRGPGSELGHGGPAGQAGAQLPRARLDRRGQERDHDRLQRAHHERELRRRLHLRAPVRHGHPKPHNQRHLDSIEGWRNSVAYIRGV